MNISKKDIINKEFTVDYKGYDSQEVDLFLDLVATNYEMLEELVNKLAQENKVLVNTKQTLQSEIETLKSEILLLKQQKQNLEAKGVENVDIITRLSKLESIVHED